MITYEVRYEILKRYVAACRWLYSIAFFQWRLKRKTFDHKIKNNNKMEDLSELIDKYMEFIIHREKKQIELKNLAAKNKKKSKKSDQAKKVVENKDNRIDAAFLHRYDFLDNYGAFGRAKPNDKPPPYLINSFERLGWPDPFPESDQMMTTA